LTLFSIRSNIMLSLAVDAPLMAGQQSRPARVEI
jgi:hypothetical protein